MFCKFAWLWKGERSDTKITELTHLRLFYINWCWNRWNSCITFCRREYHLVYLICSSFDWQLTLCCNMQSIASSSEKTLVLMTIWVVIFRVSGASAKSCVFFYLGIPLWWHLETQLWWCVCENTRMIKWKYRYCTKNVAGDVEKNVLDFDTNVLALSIEKIPHMTNQNEENNMDKRTGSDGLCHRNGLLKIIWESKIFCG